MILVANKADLESERVVSYASIAMEGTVSTTHIPYREHMARSHYFVVIFLFCFLGFKTGGRGSYTATEGE
jgi:hypothetical protein